MAKRKKSPYALGGKYNLGTKLGEAVKKYNEDNARIVPPPPGTYDPALDAALGQVERGYGDTYSDFVRDYGATGQGGRAFNDYQLAVDDVGRQTTEGRADLATARERGTQDFAGQFADIYRDRERGTQDFATTISGIARQFQQQATQQGQSLSAAGTASGGALQQALRRRQENQKLTEDPVRTAFDRFTEDSKVAEGRTMMDQDRYFTDLTTQEDRQFGLDPNLIGGAAGRALASLGLNYGRQQTDANSALERARREAGQYGIDTQTQRLYQATQQGYQTPHQNPYAIPDAWTAPRPPAAPPQVVSTSPQPTTSRPQPPGVMTLVTRPRNVTKSQRPRRPRK